MQYHPWIKCKGHEIIGNDHQFTNLPNVKQILLVSAIVIVKRKEWRIWILMLGCKGLILQSWYWFICAHSTAVALLIRERDLSFIVDSSIQHWDDKDSKPEETIDKVCRPKNL